jgi:hypothetical protein
MLAPGSRSEFMTPEIVVKQDGHIIEDADVEWYSGSELYTHPRRIRIKAVWEEVFHFDKMIEEDEKGQRSIVFRCHIGDNRIIIVLVATHLKG